LEDESPRSGGEEGLSRVVSLPKIDNNNNNNRNNYLSTDNAATANGAGHSG
jgi:hypothetical protein